MVRFLENPWRVMENDGVEAEKPAVSKENGIVTLAANYIQIKNQGIPHCQGGKVPPE
jgi:hypothetical protein